MRAAASVKKKTELPMLCITKRLRCCSIAPSGALLCNCADRLGVDAIGDQRRADAVAGNVAHEQIQMVVIQRAHQAEIAADRAHRMKVGVDAQVAPDDRLRREALLHARGERQIFFDFPLALLELGVGVAQLRFGAFLFGDVGEGDDGERARRRDLRRGAR